MSKPSPSNAERGDAHAGCHTTRHARSRAAGLRTFFRVADRWGLSAADQRTLLGDVDASAYDAWRRRAPEAAETYTTALLTRLSYLLGTYGLLQHLYGGSPTFADAWVASPNTGAAFAGRSPLALMREDGIAGMHLVRRHLEARAGGDPAPGVCG